VRGGGVHEDGRKRHLNLPIGGGGVEKSHWVREKYRYGRRIRRVKEGLIKKNSKKGRVDILNEPSVGVKGRKKNENSLNQRGEEVL